MIAQLFTSFQRSISRFCILAVSFVLSFSLIQPVIYAASNNSPQVSEQISSIDLEQKKAERRAAQSKASRAANDEEKAASIGDVINDKLNLDEIVEENAIVDDTAGASDTNQ